MRKSAVQSGAWNAHKEFAAINRATTIGDKTEQGIVAAPVHGESDVWNDWLELVAASPAAPDSSASAASSSSSTGQPTSWQEVDDRLDEQLLSTKFFVPSSSSALIPRPRLTRLLDEGIGCPLTLVSAPAGFGKTTLLSAWVHALQEDHPRVAWVSLDEGDNDLVRFWTYVLTALDHVQPGRYRELVSYLHTQQSPPVQSILTALINRLVEQTEQVVLVLDDYHLITEQAIHRARSYLLDHLPPQLRVILSSRSDPPLPLARLRACGQVLEVRTDQLRCTLEEARVFLREVMGLTLADQELEEVEGHTEGWLVGLRLLGLSLQERTDPGDVLEELHGSQRYILDYLMEEVLRRLPPSVQTFLVRTCVLKRLSASLCDVVLEQTDSQELLEFLEQANLFLVSLDRQRRWYRYHALFAEALRYRLEHTQAELAPALHHRASVWYAEHGQTTEAISHAITAREWPWAADLLEQVSAPIWGNSEHARVRHWLEQLPVEVVRSRPRLCLAYAKTLFMVAPYMTMERWLHDAETALQATVTTSTNETAEPGAFPPSERQERDNLLGEIAAYRAIITGYYLGEGHATLACCQQALAHLSAENLLARAEVAYAQSLASHACGDIVA